MMALYPYNPNPNVSGSMAFNASQPVDPYAFGASPEFGRAMAQPPQQSAAQPPDMIAQFLQQIMAALEEEEPDAEEMVAPAQSRGQAFAQNVQNAYAWQPEEQRQERAQMLYEQQMQQEEYARGRPAAVARERQKATDRRVQQGFRGLDAASLLEQRQAMAEQRRRGGPQQSITRGNVRTDIGVEDSRSSTGMSDIDYQLIPQPDGSIKAVEIAWRPQAVRAQPRWGMQNGQTGQVRVSPITGQVDFDPSLQPIPPMGAITAAVSNVEAKQALDMLVGAYNTARQQFGIEYANPSALAKIRAKISQGLSKHEWLRDLEGAGISAPKFLQFDAARKRALNSYIKAQTGAQFSVKELERYEAQFPLPWDDPETARAMLEALAAAAVGRMHSLISQYGGLQNMLRAGPPEIDRSGGAAPPSSPNDADRFAR